MNRSLALITCLALLTVSPASIAQDSSSRHASSASNTAAAGQAAQADTFDLNTFNVVFQGGTVAQYAEAVRQATGHRVNIVVNPDAADVAVPALALSSVDARAAMQLLEGRGTQRSGRTVTINEVEPSRVNAQPVFVIETFDRAVSSRRGGPPISTEISSVWSLAPIVDSGKKLEDILSAIETALAMFPENQPRPQVRLHKETNLLIANGESAQLAAIGAVLKALNPAPPIAADDVEALRGEIAAMRTLIEQLQAQGRSPARQR